MDGEAATFRKSGRSGGGGGAGGGTSGAFGEKDMSRELRGSRIEGF